MTAKYIPDQSDIRNLCPSCLKARRIVLPKGYADLGGLALCSCCGVVADCRDPDVLRRYAEAGIDPTVVFLSLPMLRAPLNGDRLHMNVIDAHIFAHGRGDRDD